MFFFVFIALFWLLVLIYKKWAKSLQNRWQEKGVKCIAPLPFFGSYPNLILNLKSAFEMFQKIYRNTKESSIGLYYEFKEEIYVLNDPDLIEEFFSSQEEDYDSQDGQDDTLFSVTEDKMQKCHEIVAHFIVALKAKILRQGHNKDVEGNDDHGNHDEVNLLQEFQKLALAFMLEITLSEKLDFCDNSLLFDHLEELDMTKQSKLKKYLYSNFPKLSKFFGLIDHSEKLDRNSYLYETVKGCVKNRRKDYNLNYQDYLQCAMQNIHVMEEEESHTFVLIETEAREEILIKDILHFIKIGFQRIYSSILIVMFHACERDLVKEITDETQLECFLLECFRMTPLEAVLDVKCKADMEFSTGLEVSRGSRIQVITNGIQQDPCYWNRDPEEFNPGRFQHPHEILNFTFMPFGSDDDNVITGESMISFLASILGQLIENFVISKCQEKAMKIKYDRHCHYTRLKNMDSFNIQLECR